MDVRLLVRGICAVALVLGAGCAGADGDPLPSGSPSQVPEGLVPDSLAIGDLRVRPYGGEEAQKAFVEAGEEALVADGKLWEIREGETLVGVLQISTLKNRVDLTEEDAREAILRGVLAGGTRSIEVQGMTVFLSETEDQTKYLWFGRRLFEVLTIKASRVEPEPVLEELLRFQVSREVWESLPQDGEAPER